MEIIHTEDSRTTVYMTLQEFIQKLGLPGRPVQVLVSWDSTPHAVRIPIESGQWLTHPHRVAGSQ